MKPSWGSSVFFGLVLAAFLMLSGLLGPDMAHGARPAIRWHEAKASWYGGKHEVGPTAHGGWKWSTERLEHYRCPNRCRAHRNGILYFAHNKTMPFHTRVEFMYRGRRCIAECRDRGPAAWTGREFDLGANTARVLRFSGVGVVKWRVVK